MRASITDSPDVDPLARALEIVGERWTLLIVRDAMGGVSRFDDFHARLGLSRKVLAVRLRSLVEHGVMTKAPYQQHPVRFDYRLTPTGVALARTIVALTDWGSQLAASARAAAMIELAAGPSSSLSTSG